MKRVTVFLGLIIFVGLSSVSFASHEIMRWQDNRTAAVSMTFDDGYRSQATTGADLLTDRGLKGTFFFLVESLTYKGPAWNLTWDHWRAVAEQGHEIGSHTISHADLTQLSELELREELSQSQATIDLNIPTQSCLTIAYPYGAFNDSVKEVTSEYYIAGRGVWSDDYINNYPGGSYDPVDFFGIGSYPFGAPSLATLEELKNYLDLAELHNAWFDLHIHDLDGPEHVARLSQFIDEVLARDMWVDTLGTIVRYMREKMSSTLTVVSENDNEIELNLTHSLDNDIYNMPVTIRSPVPTSWPEVEIRQGESVYIMEPEMEEGDAVVYYHAVPNAGVITLTLSGPLVDCTKDADCDDGLYCNGAETCDNGTCQAGGDPCPGQACIEDTDTCVDCVVDADCDDGNGCTDDVCDAQAECLNTWLCDQDHCMDNVCVDCISEAECDDGLYCNGTETCDNGTCLQGSDPCPGKACNEDRDECVNDSVPDDTGPDSDGDGVPDEQDEEPNDASIASPEEAMESGEKITVDTSQNHGTFLSHVRVLKDSDPSLNQANKPPDYHFPAGLVSFKVHTANPGDTVHVEITWPITVPQDAKYYKVDDNGFSEFSGAVFSGNVVTLTLTDGGLGDGDDGPDGVISDPGGVAVPISTQSGGDGGGGGGCFIGTMK